MDQKQKHLSKDFTWPQNKDTFSNTCQGPQKNCRMFASNYNYETDGLIYRKGFFEKDGQLMQQINVAETKILQFLPFIHRFLCTEFFGVEKILSQNPGSFFPHT